MSLLIILNVNININIIILANNTIGYYILIELVHFINYYKYIN